MTASEGFWLEARSQRACAVCGRAGGRPDFRGRTWHAHHIISRQRLRRLGRPQFDARGALRLCTDCHMSSEWGGVNRVQIKTEQLTDQGICYVVEVFEAAAEVFLCNEYTGADERLRRHNRGMCELCQR